MSCSIFRDIVRGAGASILGLALMTASQPAGAGNQAGYDLNIQPQPLGQVLQALAEQSGIQIIFFSKITEGHYAPALNGRYTPESALGALLNGTDLTYHQLNEKTIEIQPKATLRQVSSTTVNSPPMLAMGAMPLAAESQAPPVRLAQASVQGPGGNAATPRKEVSPAAATSTLQEITITGSRILLNGNDAPSPVTVLNLEEMAATKPATVFEQLSELPAFNGSGGASGIPTRGVNGGSNSGNSSLNLRGLGAIRALVLFDGHRVPPSTPDGQVDINLLPQMLMQRVDVVTGGASAVYGSDAISGVMNFVIDRKFNGVKFQAQGGQSGLHDDGSFNAGVAAGADLFGGRGHIEASYQRNSDQGLPTYLARPSIFNWTLQGDGSAANPYHPVQGVTISNMTFGGYVVGSPFNGNSFDQNGVLTKLVKTSTAGLNASRMLGGGGAYVTVTALKAKTALDQFFGRFDYDVTNSVHAFANLTAATDYSSAGSQPNLEFFYNLSGCNAFLTKAQQVKFGCDDPTSAFQQSDSEFSLNKMTDSRYSLLNSTITSTYLRNYSFLGGLEGKLGDGYHWDATYTFSETKQDVRNDGIDQDQHLFAAMDAVVDPKSGQIVCNITLTNPGLLPGCVPINLFGPSSESQTALDYSYGRVERWTTTRLNGLAGNIRGTPLNDWAGPVGVALSGEYRHQTMELVSNTPLDPISCTGIRFNCDPGATFLWGNLIASLPQVQQSTAEGAVEFNVPLLKDAPFSKSLSFNPAARYTRYDNTGNGASTSFNAGTWKLGLIWNLTDELTLRWTRSRDIRAPNLWELFNPVASTASSPGSIDYLTGNNDKSGQAPQQTGGNPNLKPEIGLTTTVGLVWRPTNSFSASIDGYLINLKDAIAVANGFNQDIQKACYASGGSSPYCQLQMRALGSYTNTSAANYVTRWFNRGVNIGALKTSGVDLETNYRTRLASRAFTLRGLVAYKPHMIYSQAALPTIDQAGAAYCACSGTSLLPNPVWRAEVFLGYELFKGFTTNLSERWRSHLFYQGNRALLEVGDGVPAYYTTNLNLNYSIPNQGGQIALYLNVQNVFNRIAPPVGSTGVQGGFPGDFGSYALGDDAVGRYLVLGLRARL